MSAGPLTLKLTGEQEMHCGGCSAAVEALLSEVEGVQEVRADHSSQRVRVKLNPPDAPPEPILAALATLGYQAILEQ